jgi:hypothetical protein
MPATQFESSCDNDINMRREGMGVRVHARSRVWTKSGKVRATRFNRVHDRRTHAAATSNKQHLKSRALLAGYVKMGKIWGI